MQLDIFSDPICPWCFIGKRRLEAALEARPDAKPLIRWRTFQLNPDMPPAGMDRQTYLNVKFGGADRAGQIYGNIASVGRTVGIDFQFDQIQVTPNTINAHRLIRMAQATQPDACFELVEHMFRAYFLEGRDIGDLATLTEIAEAAGLNGEEVSDFLDGGRELQEARQDDSMARRLGIGGVPCFIFEGQYALSGAQEPEAFFPLFDLALQTAAQEMHSNPATAQD